MGFAGKMQLDVALKQRRRAYHLNEVIISKSLVSAVMGINQRSPQTLPIHKAQMINETFAVTR